MTKLNLRYLLDIQVKNTQEQLVIEARDLGEGTDHSIDLGAIGTYTVVKAMVLDDITKE